MEAEEQQKQDAISPHITLELKKLEAILECFGKGKSYENDVAEPTPIILERILLHIARAKNTDPSPKKCLHLDSLHEENRRLATIGRIVLRKEGKASFICGPYTHQREMGVGGKEMQCQRFGLVIDGYGRIDLPS